MAAPVNEAVVIVLPALTGVDNHIAGFGTSRSKLAPNQEGRPGYEGTLSPRVVTVASLLQQAGYHTVMIGKIHRPGHMQGFDYWEVLPGQGSYYQPTFITEKGTTQYPGYVSEVVTERALNWLENSRTKDKPWMLSPINEAEATQMEQARTWLRAS